MPVLPVKGGWEGSLRGGRGIWQSPGPPLKSSLALEVGVGSGAVVVALAKELPEFAWVAVDVSAAALQVARENARRHGVAERISFFPGRFTRRNQARTLVALMVANLPYVPRAEWEQLSKEIRDYEPPEALAGRARTAWPC